MQMDDKLTMCLCLFNFVVLVVMLQCTGPSSHKGYDLVQCDMQQITVIAEFAGGTTQVQIQTIYSPNTQVQAARKHTTDLDFTLGLTTPNYKQTQ